MPHVLALGLATAITLLVAADFSTPMVPTVLWDVIRLWPWSLALIFVLYAPFAALLTRFRRWADGVAAEMQFPQDLESVRILFLRASGDEASAAIGTSTFVALMLRVVEPALLFVPGWANVLRDMMRSSSQGRAVGALFLCSLVVFCFWVIVPVAFNYNPDSWLHATVAVVTTSPLMAAFGMVVTLSIAVAVIAAAFGPALGVVSVFWDVTAESVPPGVWTIHHLTSDAPALRHSVYEHPETVTLLGKWLRR